MTDRKSVGLSEARRAGSLDRFIAAHRADAPGDEDAFNRALASMAGTSKGALEACKPDRSGD